MRLTRWAAVVALLVLGGPVAASAENFLAAVRGGVNFASDIKQGPAGLEDVIEFKTGFAGGIGLGYQLPFGFRLEGEFGYVYTPVDKDAGKSIDGAIKSYLLMANVYYVLGIPALGPFKPYVGFGIGGARVNDDHQSLAESLGQRFDTDEWRTAFAYQARAGLIYEVNKWFEVSAGYRYLNIDGGHYDVGPTKLRLNTGSQDNHSVEAGISIRF